MLARAQDKATGAGGAIWLCRCQCGVEKVIAGGMLRAGNTFSCGCLRATSIDLTGRRFYRLVALRPHAERKHHWHCLCDCGKAVIIATGNLTGGSTKSCGCYKLDFNCAKALDLSDRQFGKLIALRQVSKPLGGPFRWVCRCDCGTEENLDRQRPHGWPCHLLRLHGK